MAYNRVQAERLLAASEMPLFIDSLSDRIGSHTPARLRALVKRTRALRDKAQDLWRRQRVASRTRTASKGGRSGEANARSEQKAKVLGETLVRYERQLAKLEAAAAAPARPRAAPKQARAAKAPPTVAPAAKARQPAKAKRAAAPVAPPKVVAASRGTRAAKPAGAVPPARAAKAPAVKPAALSPLGPASESSRSKRNVAQLQQTGVKRVQAHMSARGRRTQAKRDARR